MSEPRAAQHDPNRRHVPILLFFLGVLLTFVASVIALIRSA